MSQVDVGAVDRRVEQSVSRKITGLAASSGIVRWAQTHPCLPYPIMTLHADGWPQFPPDPFAPDPARIFSHLPPLEGETMNPVALMIVKFIKIVLIQKVVHGFGQRGFR